MLTDGRGCPVAVSVFEGHTADSRTFMPEVTRLREEFGIERMVMVGDRGMISSKAIEELREADGIGWITALGSVSIRALVEQGQLQLGLFDERNLIELRSPDYPGERLVACRNPELAKLRAHKREALLAATERNLEKIKARVNAAKLAGADEIGLRVGKVINQYVEWHLREAWRALMFADPDQQAKTTRDPVAPATRSKAALAKVARRALDDGTPVHSFATLLGELATIVRNTCRTPNAGPDAPTFEIVTTPNATQTRALELIQHIRLSTETGTRCPGHAGAAGSSTTGPTRGSAVGGRAARVTGS